MGSESLLPLIAEVRRRLDNGRGALSLGDTQQVRMGDDLGGEVPRSCRWRRNQFVERFRQPSGVLPR